MEKMNNFEEFDTRVDRYLRHQMTAEEEQAFRSEIASDSEKKERARITALMIKAMQQEGLSQDNKIIEEIRGMNEAQFRKTLGLKPRVINLWPRIIKYSVAACAVGFVSFGAYRYHEYNQTVSLGNSQYIAYVSDLSEMNNVRGIVGTSDDAIREELVMLFTNVAEGMEIKNTIEKLESLYAKSNIEDSPFNEFQDDIAWNLAIAYLKNGEREKPIPILEDMVKRNVNYPEISRPAQKLIDQIKAL